MSKKHTHSLAPVSTNGFSLIELMIVVAIAAILASIAYPSYQSYIQRSNRSSAQSFMMEVGTRQQQRFLDVRTYAETMAELGMTTPTDVESHYKLTFVVTDGPPPTFTLNAEPIGSQEHDTCGLLTLDQASKRTPANCW